MGGGPEDGRPPMSDEAPKRPPPPPRKAPQPQEERVSRPEDARQEAVVAKPLKSQGGVTAEPKVQIAAKARAERSRQTVRVERDADGNPILPSDVSGPELGMRAAP